MSTSLGTRLHHGIESKALHGLEGVNTKFDYYSVSLAGELGGDLWTLNMSPLPGEQKRVLTITAATTFLLNYAAQSYPSKIDIVSQQIPGSINE